MGISYTELTSDVAGATFSSSRTVVQNFRRDYKKKQEFVTRTMGQPIYNKFVQWAFLCGLIPGKTITDFRNNRWGYCRALWTPDRWDWVDPLKDMQALIAEKDAGWISDEDVCEQTGKNRDILYAELAEEKKLRKELDISTAPVISTKAPTLQQEDTDAAEEK